jgi:steroid delta-isomerase-like uncharacterized protein
MTIEDNKTLAIQYYSFFNGEALTTIEDLIAPDFQMTIGSYPAPLSGPEGFRQLITMMRGALPDLHFTVEHLVAQDDIVVGNWMSSGTHKGGPFVTGMGALPADGHQFTIHGVSWLRIANGKLVESYVCEDAMGLITQLGGLPSQAPLTHLSSKGEVADIMERYFNGVMSQGKLELIDDLVTPEFALTILTLPAPIRGPEGLKQFVTRLRGAFPDLTFSVGSVIAEGNFVTVRWNNTGMQSGAFLGAPATNKVVTDHGVDIFRIANGKIAEIWIYEHDLQLMQQLGVVKEPATV